MDRSLGETPPLSAAESVLLSAVLARLPSLQREALAELLPQTCRLLAAELRAPVLTCVQTVAAVNPGPLPALLALIGPTLNRLAVSSRLPIVERIVQLAEVFPAGVPALFRSLGRAYDAAGEEGVLCWIGVGQEIGRHNAQAGQAFFALRSQTGQLTLRGVPPVVWLAEIQAVLLKFLHMLSDTSSGFVETPLLFVPPPLAEEERIPLPACVDHFSTYEENFRLYRVLVAHQAGRLVFGTYDCVPSALWESFPPYVHSLLDEGAVRPQTCAPYFALFPRADLIEDLFLCLEAGRIAARMTTHYRGLADDLRWAAGLTELQPAVPAALLSEIPADEFKELEQIGTASDSLVWASRLYAQFLQDEQPPDGPALVTDRDFDQAPEQAAAFMTGVNLSREGAGESEAERIARRRGRTARDLHYVYDEWDYEIGDYRSHWCELREVGLAEDNGAFFSRTLATYAELTPDIKRQFQRLRPKMFHPVTGLEDGEEVDLNAVVAARVDRRRGHAPSPKLYLARQQVKRDVGVLFLVDLSASTAAELPDTLTREGTVQRRKPRVIDVIKEALVLLSVALEELGDSYAIYGFSSRGRQDVEVYPVKTFRDALSAEVKGRIGALSPQGSTRMGTAVRHATRKLKDLASRAKLLVLLSDGYPEDPGYGKPVVPPMYGLRDTLMAFREAERSGILPYCVTVDQGGHDYLQKMCAPSRYMVLDDILSLPTELPKIYQRYIWSQWL